MKKLFSFNEFASLSDIPRLRYEGYYWLSDSSNAVLVNDETVDFTAFEIEGIPQNPFIQEANLYCKDSEVSISVRHIDSGYMISSVNWMEGNEVEVEKRCFIGHNGVGNRKLTFLEAWVQKKDLHCEDFSVLIPAGIGFTGFSEGNDNE
jgi:CRISPR type III-associated protein (TIGR04423 family)